MSVGSTNVRRVRFRREAGCQRPCLPIWTISPTASFSSPLPSAATPAERTALFRVVTALRAGGVKSTGKLHSELYPKGDMSRDAFEEVLGAMARAGLVRLSDAIFEKNGKQIPYRKVGLTRAAY